MNDFVLRGFCEECGWSVYLLEEKAYHTTSAKSPLTMALYGPCKKINPVWFLSPKQMDIIVQSKSFHNWYIEKECDHWEDSNESLAEFLRNEPFLVSQILREAGEKK